MVHKDTSWEIALVAGLVMFANTVGAIASPYDGGWTSPWENWWLDNPMLWGMPGYRDYADGRRHWSGRDDPSSRRDYRYPDRDYAYPNGYYPWSDSWGGSYPGQGYRDDRAFGGSDGDSAGRRGYGDAPPPNDRYGYGQPGNGRSGYDGRSPSYDERSPYTDSFPRYDNHAGGNSWGSYPNDSNPSGNNAGGNSWGSYPNNGNPSGNNAGSNSWGSYPNNGNSSGNNAGSNSWGSYPNNSNRSSGNAWGSPSNPPATPGRDPKADGTWGGGADPW